MNKFILFVVTLFISTHINAGSVIVHPSNAAALDDAAIKRIFLGKSKSFPGGSAAVPMSLDDDSAGAESFNRVVLGKSVSQLKSYWSKQLFTGKGTPPQSVASEAEMIGLIADNPNMIGYIEGEGDDRVKVVKTF